MARAALRRIADERMRVLLCEAASNALSDPRLAARQASAARRIAARHRVRLPYELRACFCKRCKSFAPPGAGSRVRIGRSAVRALRITCLLCGHTYRRILPRAAGPEAAAAPDVALRRAPARGPLSAPPVDGL